MPVGGSANTFVQSRDAKVRGRGTRSGERQRRLVGALAACAVVVAAFCTTALGAASPSGLALDTTSGRTTVAGALHALTATGASASDAQTGDVSAAAGVPTISAPPDVIVGES